MSNQEEYPAGLPARGRTGNYKLLPASGRGLV